MGICLETKLKNEVSNNNLPTLNVVSFQLKASILNPAGDKVVITLVASDNNVKFKCKMAGEYSLNNGAMTSLAANTEYQIPANTYFKYQTELITGASDIDDFICIKNYYSLTQCTFKDTSYDKISVIDADNQVASNIASLYKWAELKSVSLLDNFINETINDAQYEHVWVSSEPDRYPNLDLIASLQSLQAFETGLLLLTENFSPNIRWINSLLKGNIINLPLYIEYVNISSNGSNFGDISGTLENLVAKFIAGGRTSGNLILYGPSFSNVTYGGTALSTLWDNNTLPKDGRKTYMSWDAQGNISFSGTAPSGFSKYKDDYQISQWVSLV